MDLEYLSGLLDRRLYCMNTKWKKKGDISDEEPLDYDHVGVCGFDLNN